MKNKYVDNNNSSYKKMTKKLIKNQNKSNKIGNTGKYKQFNKNRGSNI